MQNLLARGRRISVALVALVVVGLAALSTPVHATGTYSNADIADRALTHVGETYGQCWTFVRDMIYQASGGTQDISAAAGGGDYFAHLTNAGGSRISDETQLVKGDVVQVGEYDSDPHLHTFIIVAPLGGSTFDVVDANHMNDQVVRHYQRSFTLDANTRAYQFGTVTGGYSNGSFLSSQQTGQVYRMAGGAPIGQYNWGPLPGYNGGSGVPSVSQSVIDSLPALPSNGAFISLYEAGGSGVYEFVGGAPVRQYNWGAIPGYNPNNVVTVNMTSVINLNHMLATPMDGAYVSIAEAGGSAMYRFVGGAPIRQYNWGAIPGYDGNNVTWVNQQSLIALDHMNATPANGALISIAEAGGNGIYTFAGGAPLRLYNWGAVPGFDGSRATSVNQQSLITLDHMNSVPTNGTWLAAAESGTVYRVAGGAALRVYNQGSLPGYDGSKVVWVNQQTIDSNDHLNATPANGTVLEGLPSATYWQINGGHRVQVSATSAAVAVDDQTVNAFPL